MYNEQNSVTSRHKITLDELTSRSNQILVLNNPKEVDM